MTQRDQLEGGSGSRSLPTVALAERHDVAGVPVLSRSEDVRRSVRHRRFGLTAVALLVAVAATGWLGVRSVSSEATGGGHELEVRYAAVTRSGLGSPFEIRVRRPGGFDQSVRVAVSAEYLAGYDVNFMWPDPASERARGDAVVWEFEPPDGEVLEVSIDGRIEPGRSSSISATVAVLDEAGEALVETDIRTVVLP